jgi:hypothetical protein
MANEDGIDTARILDEAARQHSGAFSAIEAYAHALEWLTLLAVPALFHGLSRVPTGEHLVRQLDQFLTEVPDWHSSPPHPVDRERQDEAAIQLRALLCEWTPPVLPASITDAARDLLKATGASPPEGGWDAFTYDGPMPLEDVLFWPEGITAALDRDDS